jgi:3-oxoacyl-[acyl-carrier protein] reductase
VARVARSIFNQPKERVNTVDTLNATTMSLLPGSCLDGSVALVTGGSRGIGAATARALANHGAAVAVNFHRNKSAAAAIVDGIRDGGGDAVAIKGDVTNEESVRELVRTTEMSLGPIDILILNAAGIDNPGRLPLEQLTQDIIETIILGQVRAVTIAIRAVAPGMIERRRGSVVIVTSGQVVHPADKFLALAMAKGAVEVAVRSLARELGPHGIRVNAVAPGLTLTDATTFLPDEYKQARAERTPLRRLPTAEDIAGPIVFLASPMAALVTGASLQVSGGLVMA